MTVVLDEPAKSALYSSPIGLYGFQEVQIAKAYLKLEQGGGVMAVWDTGTGKSHLAMALSAFYFEDDLIDLVILVAEKNKITKDEWPADLARFTRLDFRVHHGSDRMKKVEEQGLPQMLVTTYETGRADIAKAVKVPGRRGKSIVEGPLLPYLLGKRILFIFDESTKVKNRGSDLFKCWQKGLKDTRKKALTRCLEMTATPLERDYEDAYNQLWLADPSKMPLNGEFEKWFVQYRDERQRPFYRKGEMHKFAAMAAPMILRVRKTDPEVMAEFPKQVEESMWFDLSPQQRSLYELVSDFQQDGGAPIPGLYTVKRMIANHPASLIHSANHGDSKIARMLVEELGEDYLRAIGSVKEKGLIDYLDPVVKGQGAKAIVFTYFGPSTIPLLAVALRREGFKVYTTFGGMSMNEIAEQRTAFKTSDQPGVLLCSDAGARGVNLPQATYVVEFESALTFANRTQRINRAHRIDSTAESVTCMTFFSRHTVEQTIAENMIERNSQQDVLLADDDAGEDFISALERRRLLQIKPGAARRQKPRE